MADKTEQLRIAMLICSTRPERVGPTVAGWAHRVALDHDHPDLDIELVDLEDQGLPLLDEPEPASSGNYTRPHTRAWSTLVSGYDGFVFVTPEYNRGLPGALKNALDFLYAEWNNKAAGIVCYGSSGGLRAAEHLKSVLGELQIATVRAQVSLSIYDDMTDFTRMSPRDFQAGNVTTMLDQLAGWARALRREREASAGR